MKVFEKDGFLVMDLIGATFHNLKPF